VKTLYRPFPWLSSSSGTLSIHSGAAVYNNLSPWTVTSSHSMHTFESGSYRVEWLALLEPETVKDSNANRRRDSRSGPATMVVLDLTVA